MQEIHGSTMHKIEDLEQKFDSWQQDTDNIVVQKNEKWKWEAAENILVEVAQRKHRKTNVIYNLRRNKIRVMLSCFCRTFQKHLSKKLTFMQEEFCLKRKLLLLQMQ